MVTYLATQEFSYENCSIALVYPKFVPLNVVKSVQLLVALASLPFIVWNVRRFSKKRGTLHVNFLIVYTNAFIFYGIHSTAVFIFHLIKMIKFFSYHHPCELFTVKWGCDLFKSLCYICLIGFTLSHASMCVERALATFMANNYEQKDAKIGVFLAVLIWMISIGSNFIIDMTSSGLIKDHHLYMDYCISMGNGAGTLNVHWVMLAIDLLSTGIDMSLLKINKIKSNLVYRKVMSYDLSRRFQLTENFSTIKTIIPVVVTHSVIYTLYLICAVVIRICTSDDPAWHRTIFESVYMIISVYILAMMIVLLKAPIGKKKLENQIHQKSTEAEVYFKLFQSQVNGPNKQKSKTRVLVLHK